MKSQEEIRSFYADVLTPIIAPLEEYRSESASKIKGYIYKALLCLSFILVGIIILNPFVIILTLIPSLVFLGLAYQKLNEMNTNLRSPFKNKVLLTTIDFLFDKYEYIANQKIAKSVILKSMLFPWHITLVKGEDFMKFKIGEVIIMFCETKVYGIRERLLFNGIFISSSFYKSFNSKIFVIPKKSSAFLLKIKRQLVNKMQRVELENSEFEKCFNVLSGDQVEARYILTPSLMTRILDYKEKTKANVSISFIDNRLYCTVPNFKNLFEVPFFKPIDFECILSALEPVMLYTDLVEDLNLNLKVCSKQ